MSGAWTGAAVGTAGSMAGGIGAAALIGQVNYFYISTLENWILSNIKIITKH